MNANNWTLVTEFIILGFPNVREVELLFFFLFLLMYMLMLVENIIIILVIQLDYRLQTPMYFFIGNLSSLDIAFTTVTVPKMLANIATDNRTISIPSCFTQLYIFYFLGSSECFLLASMAYDRYLAICNPLQYTTLMNKRTCVLLAFCSWFGGFLAPVLPTTFLFQLPFCRSNVINHFFCDAPPILKLSCKDIFVAEVINFIVGSVVLLSSFSFTIVTYIFIINTILHIPSAEGQKKAFSTCGMHLTIVFIFFGTTIFMYIRTKTIHAFNFNKIVSVFYSVVTPVLNPIIYSLRNNDIKEAMLNMLFYRKGSMFRW
ncbi:olfactory receptor 6Q1-like [Python bivittatus]|uniref:Olfactory receptor n=1 Tax=Python bivittatus TaxID=176946 RepID=A0A9F2WC88_PYTBI|nr:olfactory receptor 6Q1-like [Python bivittatus]